MNIEKGISIMSVGKERNRQFHEIIVDRKGIVLDSTTIVSDGKIKMSSYFGGRPNTTSILVFEGSKPLLSMVRSIALSDDEIETIKIGEPLNINLDTCLSSGSLKEFTLEEIIEQEIRRREEEKSYKPFVFDTVEQMKKFMESDNTFGIGAVSPYEEVEDKKSFKQLQNMKKQNQRLTSSRRTKRKR